MSSIKTNTSLDVNQLIFKLGECQKEMNELHRRKYEIECERSEIVKQLSNKCIHNMITDNRYCDEHTVYVCSKCGLNNFDILRHKQ